MPKIYMIYDRQDEVLTDALGYYGNQYHTKIQEVPKVNPMSNVRTSRSSMVPLSGVLGGVTG